MRSLQAAIVSMAKTYRVEIRRAMHDSACPGTKENSMFVRVMTGGAVAALTGVAMLVISASSASAFSLSSPSLQQPMASSHVDHVWWDSWGRWHPNHPYWGPRYWGPVAPVPGQGWNMRHCWRGYYGHLHCNY
jgi:hypothetical protein